MVDQIYIGNYQLGFTNNTNAFNLDNDAFPTLYNFYVWRQRVKKKRGTSLIGQLQRQMESVLTSTPPETWEVGTIMTLDGAGEGTADVKTVYSLATTATIVPSSITLTDGTNTFTEPATPDGTLVGAPGGTGTINYSDGTLTIVGGAAAAPLIGTFSYFPGLPVMGLRDQSLTFLTELYPLLHAFDTTYDYQLNQTVQPPFFYTTNFHKATGSFFQWSGLDYQQFFTRNYQSAFWATNNKPGFHFQAIATITVGNPTVIDTAAPHGMITNDWVFFNEITGADADKLNMQAFQIIVTSTTQFTVAVNTTGDTISSDGIFQKLTTSTTGQDGIRWYDGDPTNGTGLPTNTGLGWVNFAPPLTANTISIDNNPLGLYYLVGALAIVDFKDRMLFFSPWIQTSTGAPIQLPDTVLWSWNGTPYYNALTPGSLTYDETAYYVDQTGKGGYLSAGISQPIATVAENEDVLIIGFGGKGTKTRFVYTGNDLQPFLFYSINSELPSSSTFSAISLDAGVIDIGTYGIAITDQQSSQRIDLQIPDYIFNVQNTNNGFDRVNGIRDFKNEWLLFSFPYAPDAVDFPTQTFFYNYRENSWAVFYENYTSHGYYRARLKKTWATQKVGTWAAWRTPWSSGSLIQLYTSVIAGNPQGYVIEQNSDNTYEAPSGTLLDIVDNGGSCQINSINHCVTAGNVITGKGDYLYFTLSIGDTQLNGRTAQVIRVIDKDSFVIDIDYDPTGAYEGLGKFTRLIQPILQTKQFPFYWEKGRAVRLCSQKYLLDATESGEITVNIFLSQDATTPINAGFINPDPQTQNETLIYSQKVFTSLESTNLGLTPANVNLQMPQGFGPKQIWHRMNTSLIGDSVQIGITLNDEQMRDINLATNEVVLNAMQLTVAPSRLLA